MLAHNRTLCPAWDDPHTDAIATGLGVLRGSANCYADRTVHVKRASAARNVPWSQRQLLVANARQRAKNGCFCKRCSGRTRGAHHGGRVRPGIGDLARVCAARSFLCIGGPRREKARRSCCGDQNGRRASHRVHADVREYAQVEHAVESAVAKFGALDILVNSAAGNFFLPLRRTVAKRLAHGCRY